MAQHLPIPPRHLRNFLLIGHIRYIIAQPKHVLDSCCRFSRHCWVRVIECIQKCWHGGVVVGFSQSLNHRYPHARMRAVLDRQGHRCLCGNACLGERSGLQKLCGGGELLGWVGSRYDFCNQCLDRRLWQLLRCKIPAAVHAERQRRQTQQNASHKPTVHRKDQLSKVKNKNGQNPHQNDYTVLTKAGFP